MRVLFVTSEAFPLVKTGGLADVCGALPRALRARGADARLILPGYPSVLERAADLEPVAAWPELFGGPGRLLVGRSPDGTPLLVVDAAHLYGRPGNPYVAANRRDWPDNDRRFAALAWVAANLPDGGGWTPDVIHAHDWQAGLAPAYLAHRPGRRPATVMTIHNMAFSGAFPAARLAELRLPPSSFALDGVEFYGQIGFLKAGLAYADRITTVSPTYAREIREPGEGGGLDGLLRHRAGVLEGILNGVDLDVWDPANDPALALAYDAASVEAKAANKRALQERLGLATEPGRLVFGVVSRMSWQKGLDLLPGLARGIVDRGGQLVVIGSGEIDLEAAFSRAAAADPAHVAVVVGYDEGLSHLIQGGADAILVPSRFEPCGLTQLCALRYGTVPVVSRVGGLADTVIDANAAALDDGVATGFVFGPTTGTALAGAVDRAFALFADGAAWDRLRRHAMTRDVGWDRPAEAYLRLYQNAIRDRDRP